MFKTIKENSTSEIVEKKSKFIANSFYVESVEEAEKYIKEINKKYFDSRHNCYAFSVYTKNGIINRFSDNGEPSGTAGGPMLNIILSKKLSNVLIIVTRYFGGILLGTGGLVRSYSEATQNVLLEDNFINKDIGLEVKFEVSYSDFEKIKYYFSQNNINILSFNFVENVEIIFEILEKDLNKIIENIQNLNFKIIKKEVLKEKYIEVNI